MPRPTRKSLNTPDEDRPFEDGTGHLELIDVDDGWVARATYEPGWQWSKHVKPIAGTESCQATHRGYFVSGRLHVEMTDGQSMEYGPGDFAIIPPGHDAWVLGDVPVVLIDWYGDEESPGRR